jgi:hypothetical protein
MSAAVAMVPDSNYSEMGSVMTAPAWPLQTRLPLAALPTAPAVARGNVCAVPREWGLESITEKNRFG